MAKAFKVSGKMTLDTSTFRTSINTVSKDLGKFAREQEKRFTGLKRSWGTLGGQMGGLLASMGTGFSVVGALKAADAYQAMQRRLEAATRATGDFGKVSQAVFSISQRTFSQLSGTELTFRSLSLMKKEIGASNDEILKVTDAIQKLGAMGGVSSEELMGGIRQFSQVMGKGRLMAEELNILMVNMPQLGMAIMRGLGMSQGELRKLMEQGKVSSQMVFQAILRESRNVNKEFSRFAPTLGQQFNQVSNEFQKKMGENASWPLKAIGASLGLIRDNMNFAIGVGGLVTLGMAANVAKMSLGTLYGTLAMGLGSLKNAAGWVEKMTASKKAATVATKTMTLADAQAPLALEKMARSAGVYVTVSDAVRKADAARLTEMNKLGALSKASAAAQAAQAARAGTVSTQWGMRVSEAQKKAAAATRAVNLALSQASAADTVGESVALTNALKQEAAAMSHLSTVSAAAASAKARVDSAGQKLAATWSGKLAKAEKAASKAAEAATIMRAKEIVQLQQSSGLGLTAAAIKDGESRAVLRYMRLIDLETATLQRNNAERQRQNITGGGMVVGLGRLGQVGQRAGGAIRTVWGAIGGLSGALVIGTIAVGAAAYAIKKYGEAMDVLDVKQRAAVQSADEFIARRKEMLRTPDEQKKAEQAEDLSMLGQQRRILDTLQAKRRTPGARPNPNMMIGPGASYYANMQYETDETERRAKIDKEIESTNVRIKALEEINTKSNPGFKTSGQMTAEQNERMVKAAEAQAKTNKDMVGYLKLIAERGKGFPGGPIPEAMEAY